MQSENAVPQAPQETGDDAAKRPGLGDRLRDAVGSVGETVTGTTDTITGLQFRKQFEDFTDAVATAVVGVHRDQGDLRERVDALETARQADPTPQQVAELQVRVDALESARPAAAAELPERVEKPEKSGKVKGRSPLTLAFGLVSALALLLALLALARTF